MRYLKALCFLTCSLAWSAATIDLRNAVVLAPASLSSPEKKAVAMLVEEVEKRAQIRWTAVSAWPTASRPVIAVGQAGALRPLLQRRLERMAPATEGREGYRLQALGDAVLVVGNDERGTLFGVGRLLRSLRMERQRV